MKVGELKKLLEIFDDDTDVNVPSSYDGDYAEDAKADIDQYADGRKFLLIHA